MNKSIKTVVAITALLAIVLMSMGLIACDGTKDTFASFVKNAYEGLPDGSGVKEVNWSAEDGYTLAINDQGNVVCTDNDYVVCIEKQVGKDFVVLNLADVQIGAVEIEWQASFLEVAEKTIAKLIEDVKPDLITLTGDQGYGEELAFKTVYEYIDSLGIPWAPVFGNHDNQCREITCAGQAERLATIFNNCLFKVGPTNLGLVEEGEPLYGNYIVNVVEKNGSDFNVVKSIILVNSGEGQIYDPEEYKDQTPVNDDWYASLTSEQIAWYKWAVQGVQQYGYNGKVSSMMVLHIPIYAYSLAYAEAINADISVYDYEAINEYGASVSIEQGMESDDIWAEGYKDSFGVRHEACCCPPYDDHVFDAILDYDDDASTTYVSTDLVLAGHDHINNCVINYKGVTLAYGLKTGSGCYWEDDMSGGSVITISSEGATNIHHEFYNPNVPVLPRWVIALICIGATGVVATIIAISVKCAKRNKSICL